MNSENSALTSQANLKNRNIHQRLNAIRRVVKTVDKNSTVSTGQNSRSYQAVSHDDVASLLHDPMVDNGVSLEVSIISSELEAIKTQKTFNGQIDEKISYLVKLWVEIAFVNEDNNQDKSTSKTFAYALDASDKATGKALSLAVKNIYLKVFNLESRDNEESRDYENYNSSYDQPKIGQKSPINGTQQRLETTPVKDHLASEAQVKALKKLYPDTDLTGLTKSEAKKMFDKLNEGRK